MRLPANWDRFRRFLWPVALFYHALVWWRNLYYKVGFFVSRQVSVPVVSVGNLAVGGTGKTPAVIFLARHLQQLGYRPGIVSRGYGRQSSGTVEVSDGRQLLVGSNDSGDEPGLIARRLPSVPVVVDEDRHRGACELIARSNPDVIILDDGFQHRGLARDCDLVLLDAGTPRRDYHMFPYGRLREPVSALKRCSAVVWTRTEQSARPAAIAARVARYRRPEIMSTMVADPALINLSTGQRSPATALAGKNIVAFCGLARPRSFYHTLMELGLEPDKVRYFPDHHRYDSADLQALAQLLDGPDGVLITTEKDGIKLPPEFLKEHQVYAVRINFEINAEELEKLTGLLLDCLPAPGSTASA